MFILWLYQNLFQPNLVWHLTCHIIVKILESCLITMYYDLDFYLPLSCACVRARVCVRVSMCEFFGFFCMHFLYAVCWMGVDVFFVLLFYVIYSRTIASIANVFCWLYPTLNKVYLILSYLISNRMIPDSSSVVIELIETRSSTWQVFFFTWK